MSKAEQKHINGIWWCCINCKNWKRSKILKHSRAQCSVLKELTAASEFCEHYDEWTRANNTIAGKSLAEARKASRDRMQSLIATNVAIHVAIIKR